MEAIAALALACNVTQLIGQSITVAKTIKQVYNDGSTTEHADIYRQAQTLRELVKDVQDHTSSMNLTPAATPTTAHKPVEELASRCAKIATDLCSELDKLKGAGGRRKAVSVALRALLKRGVIEDLQTNLRREKETLETAILMTLKAQVQDQSLLTRQQSDDLDKLMQHLKQGMDTNEAQLQSLADSLIEQFRRTQAEISDHVDEGFRRLRTDIASAEARKSILQSLMFPEMNTRINQIDFNECDTFEWIFKTSRSRRCQKWDSFADWLCSDKGLYWIQGKAGSGKSTLMKFLWDHKKTRDLLSKSSSSTGVCILKYSFWLSGTPMQRSTDGCYRCLFYQLLQESDDSIAILQNHPEWVQKRYTGDWSNTELERGLLPAIESLAQSKTVCIFIDALDEIAGRDRYPSFIELVRRLTKIPGVKVCVSSRPEVYWCTEFESDPQLRLQDLITGDIRKYVTARLKEVGYVEPKDNTYVDDTVSTICEKAEGVFLWAYLAMRSIIQALDGHASRNEVNDLIEAMPTEIGDLYQTMIQKQSGRGKSAQKEAALYFKLLLCGISDTTDLVNFKLKLDGKNLLTEDTSFADLQRTAGVLQERIPHICLGMISYQRRSYYNWHHHFNPSAIYDSAMHFQFFHRTVKDFLTDFEAGRNLLHNCYLNDEEILYTLVEGRLRVTIAADKSLVLRELRACVMQVLEIKHSGVLHISTKAIIRTIKILDDAFVPSSTYYLPTSTRALPGQDIQGSQRRLLSMQPVPQNPNKYPHAWHRNERHCIDVAGLSIVIGLREYVEDLLKGYATNRPASDINLSPSYKNYLLLCAINGIWPCRASVIKVASSLIAAGADPYAVIYLPPWRPQRRCAAADLASSALNTKFREKNDWTDFMILLNQILALGEGSLEFCVMNFARDYYTLRCMDDPIRENISIHVTTDYFLCFQMPLHSQLEQISRCMIEKQTLVRLALQDIVGNLWVGSSSRVDDHKGDTIGLVLLTDEESSSMRRDLEGLSKQLTPNTFMEARGLDTPLQDYTVGELVRKLEGLYASKPPSERVDEDTFRRMHGYLLDATDPKVTQNPIVRFESVESFSEQADKKEKEEEIESHDEDQDCLSQSSGSIFFDAQE